VRDRAAWDALDWTAGLARARPVVGTVTDPAPWAQAPPLDGVRGIIHLAALVRHSRRGAREVYRTNVDGTLAMVRLAAARRCRLIFVSTSGTVGCCTAPGAAADEAAPHCEAAVARWPYYHSKVMAERAARDLARAEGVELVIVRPPVLLGPGDHRFRSTAHLVRYARGRLPFLVPGGIHFADVRDAAAALARAALLPAARPVYHLTGTICTIEEFFALAADVSGIPAPRRAIRPRLAWWLATLLAPLRVLPDPVVVELASHHWGTTSRYAEQDLAYRNRDARATLADTMAWLARHHPALAPRSRGS
jgi:nucleoside-diphosphate-sugar epimerase